LINPGECLARILKRKRKRKEIDMWKLTITQKRKSEYTDGTINETVEFFHRNIGSLTSLVDNLNNYSSGIETTYKIEKVGEE
jgi:hypothetical protein